MALVEACGLGKLSKRICQGIFLRRLQLNVKGLTASKLDVVEQLALVLTVTIILLQETQCQSVGKVVLKTMS